MISTGNHIANLVVVVSNVLARHGLAASKTVGLPGSVG
jgi:hypothetical protein